MLIENLNLIDTVVTSCELNNQGIEFHPNKDLEVGYYDISGENNFKFFVCKKPNFIQKWFVKKLFGWEYYW